jgi:hypothetical protein
VLLRLEQLHSLQYDGNQRLDMGALCWEVGKAHELVHVLKQIAVEEGLVGSV